MTSQPMASARELHKNYPDYLLFFFSVMPEVGQASTFLKNSRLQTAGMTTDNGHGTRTRMHPSAHKLTSGIFKSFTFTKSLKSFIIKT